MKTAFEIILTYQKLYSSMSSYIDNQLLTIRQLLIDANYHEKEGDAYWCQVNLELAEKLTVAQLQMVTQDGVVRELLVELYKSITDKRRSGGEIQD